MLEVDKNNSELENYGVWVKSGPENYSDNSKPAASDDFELTDLENSSDNFLLTEEEERLLDSLEDNVKKDEEDDLFNVQEIDDMSFEEDFDSSLSGEEDFIDIDIPQSIEEKEAASEKSQPSDKLDKSFAGDEKSVEILTQIAADLKNDLSSIKNELHELKQELARYKKLELSESVEEASFEPEKDEESASGGFFSDDGDETIALTGDELDNIFNTAEITEESTTFEKGEIPDEDEAVKSSVSEPDVQEEDEAVSAGTSAFEAPEYEENSDEMDFLEGNIEDSVTEDSAEIELTDNDTEPSESGEKDSAVISAIEEANSVNLPDTEMTEEEINLEDDIADDIDLEENDNIFSDSTSDDENEITLGDMQETTEDINLNDDINLEEDLGSFELPDSEELSLKEDSSEVVKDSVKVDNFTADSGIEEEIPLDEEQPEDNLPEDIIDIEEEISLEEPADDSVKAQDDDLVLEEEISLDDAGLEEETIDDGTDLETSSSNEESFEEESADDYGPSEISLDDVPEEIEDKHIEEEISFDESAFEVPSLDEDLVIEEDFSGNTDETEKDSEEIPDEILEEDEPEDEVAVEIPVETEIPDKDDISADITETSSDSIPENLRTEIKSVLVYLDQLLEALPDKKIEEFAKSEHFRTYKKLFEELGLM